MDGRGSGVSTAQPAMPAPASTETIPFRRRRPFMPHRMGRPSPAVQARNRGADNSVDEPSRGADTDEAEFFGRLAETEMTARCG